MEIFYQEMSEIDKIEAGKVDILLQFGKPSFWSQDGKPPLVKLRELGYHLPEEFACLPSVVLDDVSTFWIVKRW